MERLLILEDEITSQVILKNLLSEYEVVLCSSISEAEELIIKESFDLYIFDLNLPDGSSLDLLKKGLIPQSKNLFFISSSKDLHPQLISYELGAKDFIEKPFNPLLLKAKVKAWLPANKDSAEPLEIKFNGLRLDVQAKRAEVIATREKIDFTKTEFNLLLHMLRSPQIVYSRQQLVEEVLGGDANVMLRTIDAHMSKIRKKLCVFKSSIRSVHGFGYGFYKDSFMELEIISNAG
jgi:two-component system response regulator ResD